MSGHEVGHRRRRVWWPRWSRPLERWWVTALLVAALVLNVRLVLGQSRQRGAAGPGWLGAATKIMPEPGTAGPIRYGDLYVVRDPGGGAGMGGAAEASPRLRIINPERESMSEMGGLMVSHPERIIRAAFTVSVSQSGLWALTHEQRTAQIELDPFQPGAFTPEELRAARELVVPVFAEFNGGMWAALAAAAKRADVDQERTLWSGYGVDVATALLLGGVGLSLGWVPRAVAAVRARRGRRWAARGWCPGCGYDLAGQVGDECPECGRRVPRDGVNGAG